MSENIFALLLHLIDILNSMLEIIFPQRNFLTPSDNGESWDVKTHRIVLN